jgi:hypothetical protein
MLETNSVPNIYLFKMETRPIRPVKQIRLPNDLITGTNSI